MVDSNAMPRLALKTNNTPDKPERLRCFLTHSLGTKHNDILFAVREAILKAGMEPFEHSSLGLSLTETLLGELAVADCMIADLSRGDLLVVYEVGAAQAIGKPVILIAEEGNEYRDYGNVFTDVIVLSYSLDPKGIKKFKSQLISYLTRFRETPPGGRDFRNVLSKNFLVDWDRISREDAENLCSELLAQMGFSKLDWAVESREIDLVTELPKKDPDGFEYRELWTVSMGRNTPIEVLIDMATNEPDFFLHRFLRFSEMTERVESYRAEVPITVLIISWEDGPRQGVLFEMERSAYKTRKRRGFPYGGIRTRIWDRAYLTSLVKQYPQLGYKYFSDDGRSTSKYRKTPEELYIENTAMSVRLTQTVEELKDERSRRVRAERDAVWKDISFSAAHKLGNPIFAIETILPPLEKRISEGKNNEALEMSQRIRVSLEKAKGIIDQFKSLASVQRTELTTIQLSPILHESCRVASDQGVVCKIDCSEDITVSGDPVRLAECFDELVSNSLAWFNKENKLIEISVQAPAPTPLPVGLEGQFALIHFRDNGSGVPVDRKVAIFDAFFTTSTHGTGLGLALVRRIIEGHFGAIFETGRSGDGVDFEIYLPLATVNTHNPSLEHE